MTTSTPPSAIAGSTIGAAQENPCLEGIGGRCPRDSSRSRARDRHREAVAPSDDQKNHETAVEAVVANLAYEVVRPSATGHIAVLTGNGPNGFTRYDNPAFGKPLRSCSAILRSSI